MSPQAEAEPRQRAAAAAPGGQSGDLRSEGRRSRRRNPPLLPRMEYGGCSLPTPSTAVLGAPSLAQCGLLRAPFLHFPLLLRRAESCPQQPLQLRLQPPQPQGPAFSAPFPPFPEQQDLPTTTGSTVRQEAAVHRLLLLLLLRAGRFRGGQARAHRATRSSSG